MRLITSQLFISIVETQPNTFVALGLKLMEKPPLRITELFCHLVHDECTGNLYIICV